MNTATAYLESIEKHFRSYKSLAEKAMDQLTEAEMLWQPTPNSNSIAIILSCTGVSLCSSASPLFCLHFLV